MQPVMSCAGIKTHPRCAKFCTHEAVATCESSVRADLRSINDNFQRNMRNIQRNNINDDDNNNNNDDNNTIIMITRGRATASRPQGQAHGGTPRRSLF